MRAANNEIGERHQHVDQSHGVSQGEETFHVCAYAGQERTEDFIGESQGASDSFIGAV
jgi:hypothetical protein